MNNNNDVVEISVQPTIENIKVGKLDVSKVTKDITKEFSSVAKSVNEQLGNINMDKATASTTKAVNKITEAANAEAQALKRVNEALEEAGRSSPTYAIAAAKKQEQIDAYNNEARNLIEAKKQKAYKRLNQSYAKDIQRLRSELERLQEMKAAGRQVDTYGRDINEQIKAKKAEGRALIEQREASKKNIDAQIEQSVYVKTIREEYQKLIDTVKGQKLNPKEFLDFASIDTSKINEVITAYKELLKTREQTNKADDNLAMNVGNRNNVITAEYKAMSTEMERLVAKSNELAIKQQAMSETGVESSKAYEQMRLRAKELEIQIESLAQDMQLMVYNNADEGGAFRITQDDDSIEEEIAKITGQADSAKEALSGIGEGAEIAAATGHPAIMAIVTAFKKLVEIVTKVKAIIEKITKHIKDALTKALNRAKSAITKVSDAFGGIFGSNSSSSSNGGSKAVKKLLKSFMQFGLGARSLYFLIKRLRNEFINLFKAMAVQIPEINTQVSSFMTALNQFKGTIATAFQPIVTYVLPVLNQLMLKLADVLNVVGEFMATLTGQGYVYKFTSEQIDYAESLEETGKAAKDAKTALAGFDTVMKLSFNTTKDTNDVNGTWNLEKLDKDSNIVSWADKFKQAWSNADFTSLTNELGNKLVTMFNTATDKLINEVGPFADKLATSLATAINGLTSTQGLPEAIGTFIGTSINTAMSSLNKFLTTTNWIDIGSFIVKTLNNMLTVTKAELIGQTVANFIRAGVSMWYGFVKEFDFSLLGTKITDAITGFANKMDEVVEGAFDDDGNALNGWQLLGYNIYKSLDGIMDTIIVALKNMPWIQIWEGIADGLGAVQPTKLVSKFIQVVQSIANTILLIVQKIPWEKLAQTINGSIEDETDSLTTLFNTIGKIVKSIFNGLITFVQTLDWVQLGITVGRCLAAVDWPTILFSAIRYRFLKKAGIASTIFTALFSFADSQEFQDAMSTFDEAYTKAIGENKSSEEAYQVGVNAISGMIDGITDAKSLNILATSVSMVADIPIEQVKKDLKINSPSKVMEELGGYTMEGFYDGIVSWEEPILQIFNDLKTNIDIIINSMITSMNKLLAGVTTTLNSMATSLNAMSFKIPDWVPEYGGKSLKFNIPTIQQVQIPKLAQGAVIPPNKEFLAVLGDQKEGTNIEAPMSTIEEAVRKVMAEQQYNFNIEATGSMGALVRALNLQIKRENSRASAF